MSYQGWTNYPTWCIHLWITNDEGLYRAWRDEARDSWADAEVVLHEPKEYRTTSRRSEAKYNLADKLKDSWEYQMHSDLKLDGFWADLVSHALGEVDWNEVAGALLEEVEEDE